MVFSAETEVALFLGCFRHIHGCIDTPFELERGWLTLGEPKSTHVVVLYHDGDMMRIKRRRETGLKSGKET